MYELPKLLMNIRAFLESECVASSCKDNKEAKYALSDGNSIHFHINQNTNDFRLKWLQSALVCYLDISGGKQHVLVTYSRLITS